MTPRDLLRFLDRRWQEDPALGRLLDLSVRRILIDGRPYATPPEQEIDVTFDQLRHVLDWLESALANASGWLARTDALGRPRKLMALHTLDDLLRVADEAMAEAARTAPLEGFDPAVDERRFAELEDGFYLVKLLTPRALDMESSRMGHCIGNGSYDRYLGRSLFLSLRSPNGSPHATLHVTRFGGRAGEPAKCMMLVQSKGKQNRAPVRKHRDRLRPFIVSQDYRLVEEASHTGLVRSDAGGFHPVESIPEGFTTSSGLDLRGTGVAVLPARMTVGLDLDLRGCPIRELPEDLTVGGNLRIDHTAVERLPGRIRVGRAIHSSGAPIAGRTGYDYRDDGYVVEIPPEDEGPVRLGA